MRKLGNDTIKCILDRSIKEFMEDSAAPRSVSFYWKGHYVESLLDWSSYRCAFYVSQFSVTYSRCVMTYKVIEDFDLRLAWCI